MSVFFERSDVLNTIERVLKTLASELDKSDVGRLDTNEEDLSLHNKLMKINHEILIDIQNRKSVWDEYCQHNTEAIGEILLENFKCHIKTPAENIFLEYIAAQLFRFLVEFKLSIATMDLDDNLNAIYYKIIDLHDQFNEESKSSVRYAQMSMPISILKKIIQNEKIFSVVNFSKTLKKIEDKERDITTFLTEQTTKVDVLKDTLAEQETAFNFVGLYKGFEDLAKAKKSEKCWSFLALMLMGIAVISLLSTELCFLIHQIVQANAQEIEKTVSNPNIAISFDNIKTAILLLALPLTTLTALLIYFFRIVLLNFKSIQSQLLQIELRKTLCQFIQNYSKYSSEMSKENKESLSKFENIIFSGIVADEKKMPSTFDGVDQLAKLVGSLKKS